MKLGICVPLLLPLLFAIGVFPACADVTVYNNGPVNGAVGAWTINYGFTVTDSFTLSSAADISGVTFAVWAFSGDAMTGVDWSITTAAFGGTTEASGTASTTQTYDFTNGSGYDIDYERFSIPGVTLIAGTYWLQLQNAVVASGDPIFWDENDGPSSAYLDSVDFPIGSETFKITSPEPDSIILLCTLLLAAALGMTALRSRSSRG
jgi:hypothetical protein